MILLIDNYDSFTYNLAQLFMRLGEEVKVIRNDEIDLEQAEALDFDQLVISPGPGRPESAGLSIELIRRFAGRKPILGVCLGHQAIGAAFGARIVRAKRIMHGKSDMIEHDGKTLFSETPNPLRVIRYHSLAVERASLPPGFEVAVVLREHGVRELLSADRGMRRFRFLEVRDPVHGEPWSPAEKPTKRYRTLGSV